VSRRIPQGAIHKIDDQADDDGDQHTGTTEASVMRCTCTFTYIARKEKTVWKRLFGLALFRG